MVRKCKRLKKQFYAHKYCCVALCSNLVQCRQRRARLGHATGLPLLSTPYSVLCSTSKIDSVAAERLDRQDRINRKGEPVAHDLVSDVGNRVCASAGRVCAAVGSVRQRFEGRKTCSGNFPPSPPSPTNPKGLTTYFDYRCGTWGALALTPLCRQLASRRKRQPNHLT